MSTSSKYFDVTIIGGGLHGAAIAADCAGRGLKTLLCHRGDVGGSHGLTSKRLFHCGLQYLQRGDIARVNESLAERKILSERAPHLSCPTNVIIPQEQGVATTLKLNTKAFLYNLIARDDNHLEAGDISDTEYAEPLQSTGKSKSKQLAIHFEDATINDSQLTIENLILAQEKGATILPHTSITKANREDGCWIIHLQDADTGTSATVHSKCIVNATGPAAGEVQQQKLGITSRSSATNYKAAYLITQPLFDGPQSYLLEQNGNQLISALNYADKYTLIGPFVYETTHQGSSGEYLVPESVENELIRLTNSRFKTQLTDKNILHRFSIFSSSYKESTEDQPTPFAQDYALDFNCSDGQSPSVTLFGTCTNMHRLIAEQVIEQIVSYLPNKSSMTGAWTHNHPLPGGYLNTLDMEAFALSLADEFDWIPKNILNRYISIYGTRCNELLKGCKKLEALGKEIVPGLFEKEVRWLHDKEWALTPEAIIWHRTKLGLELSEQNISLFNQWFNNEFPYHAPLLGLQMRTEMNKQAS